MWNAEFQLIHPSKLADCHTVFEKAATQKNVKSHVFGFSKSVKNVHTS